MAQLIAATTAAANTSGGNFTVTSKSAVKAYGMVGSEFVVGIYTVNSDTSLTPLTSSPDVFRGARPVTLTGDNKAVDITSPGNYRFVKSATTGTVGIDVTPAT